MLRQVDDFLISCKQEDIAKRIFDYIGKKLQLSGKKVPPFKYLGIAKDYNGVDITQTKQYIEISCPGYIDCVTCAHSWDKPDDTEIKSRPTAPMPER